MVTCLVLGATTGHLGQSAPLAEVFNREDGDAPNVDLDAESAHGEFILANRDMIRACSDLGMADWRLPPLKWQKPQARCNFLMPRIPQHCLVKIRHAI